MLFQDYQEQQNRKQRPGELKREQERNAANRFILSQIRHDTERDMIYKEEKIKKSQNVVVKNFKKLQEDGEYTVQVYFSKMPDEETIEKIKSILKNPQFNDRPFVFQNDYWNDKVNLFQIFKAYNIKAVPGFASRDKTKRLEKPEEKEQNREDEEMER